MSTTITLKLIQLACVLNIGVALIALWSWARRPSLYTDLLVLQSTKKISKRLYDRKEIPMMRAQVKWTPGDHTFQVFELFDPQDHPYITLEQLNLALKVGIITPVI